MVALRLRLIAGCILMLAGMTTVAQSLYAQYPANYPTSQQPGYSTQPISPVPPSTPGYATPDLYEAQDKGLAPMTPPVAPPAVAGNYPRSYASAPNSQPTSAPPSSEAMVKGVRFEGNHSTDVAKLPKLNTRVGQPFDHRLVLEDIRTLNSLRQFLDAKVKYREVVGGIEVIFQVVERPTMTGIIFVGNQDKTTRSLTKKSELQKNGSLDPYQIEETRRRLEEEYRSGGYPHASVQVLEGDDLKDSKAVFSVHEGTRERILHTTFEGNTIVSDGRVRTQIGSSRSFLGIGGSVDRKKIEDDVTKLTSYYRALGYFDAKVGRILEYGDSKKWLTVRFVINEGPRYHIRKVSFIGNEKFANETLEKDLVLKPGEPFNQDSLNKDRNILQDIYGGHGYIFADVKPDPRLLDDKPEVDLVFDITEGRRYRAGRIEVHIGGENPHTAHSVVMNRMSVRPGDIIDTRKIRNDERRLRFSQVFETDPTKGGGPKISFEKPDDLDKVLADESRDKRGSPSPSYRGQSPDDAIELDVVYVRSQNGDTQTVYRPISERPASQNAADNRVRMQSPDAYRSSWNSAPNNHWQNYNAPAPQTAPQYRTTQAQPVAGPTARTASTSPYLPPGAQALPPNTITSPGAYQTTPDYQPPAAPAYPRTTAPTYPVSAPSPSLSAPAPSYSTPPVYQQPNPSFVGAPPSSGFDPYASPQPPAYGASAYGGQQPYVVNQQPGFGDPLVTPQGGAAGGVSPFDPAAGIGPIGGPLVEPSLDPTVPIIINADERQTGRLMLGVGVNSDAGLVGNFVLDEQNFDIARLPRSWEDIRNGTAWRGRGQRFRLEANPGTVVQRYAVSFQEPYLFGTPNQLSLSGFYFTRIYRDWNEERLGGKVGIGRFITEDFTVRGTFRGERVTIYNPSNPDLEALKEVVGNNALYGFGVGASHDNRDSPFLPTQGHLISADFEQVVGSFEYPRVILDGRQYFLLRERADRSGRHTLSIGGTFGVTGSNTPIYDNFFAGGFSTLRGFAFRGASPVQQNVQVGGQFELLGTAEYMFPITADDALRGVISCDFGTVEQSVGIHWDQFRVAPGFGLRINVPAMGPAPLAFDFNFPVAFADTDQRQVFAFFVVAGR